MLLQELGNASNKIHERNLAKRENCCFFKNTSEIEDFRSSFAQTEGLTYPAHQCLWHLSCHVPCKTGMTRDGARVGSGNPPCLFGPELKPVREDRAKELRKLHVSAPTEPIFGWIQ